MKPAESEGHRKGQKSHNFLRRGIQWCDGDMSMCPGPRVVSSSSCCFLKPGKKLPYRNYLNVPILKQAMVDVYVCLSRISQRIKSGQVYDRYWYVPVVSHWFNQSQALNKATTTCRVLYQPYVIRDVGLVEFHSIAPHITLPKTKMDTPKWWFWKGNSWKHGNCWYLC